MARRPDGGTAGIALAVLAVVGLSVAVVRYQTRSPTTVKRESGGEPVRFSGSATVRELEPVLPSSRLPGALTVAILRDSASVEYYGGPARPDSIVGRWRALLESAGATVRVVDGAGLLRARDADVLVIPAMPCLSEPARQAAVLASTTGQGLVVTWLSGTRDWGCRPVGYQFLTSLTGASRIDTLEHRPETYVTVPSGGPLAADIPPGARLEMLVANHVALRTPRRDAFWSDFMLNPMPAHKQSLLDGAVAHGERGNGRVVYWGFDLPQVVRSEWNQKLAALLVRNSVAWAAGERLTSVEAWPKGFDAAAVIAQDVEDEFANARHALDTLEAAGVRGTYFFVSDLAQKEPELARDLAARGEVGTHTENHRLLGGSAPSVQLARLRETQRALTALVGRPAAGLRPPEEQYDAATLGAWAQAGGTYIFGANDARCASPEIFTAGGRAMVLIGRAINDDFILVRRTSPDQRGRIADDWLAALRKIRNLGGVYMLSYHSQLLARPEYVPVLGTVARAARADQGIWLTTAGEVADWWLARSVVSTRATRAGDSLLVEVANAGTSAVDGVIVRVDLAAGERAVGAAGGSLAAPDEMDDPGVVRVALPRLAAGATTAVSIALAARAPASGTDAR